MPVNRFLSSMQRQLVRDVLFPLQESVKGHQSVSLRRELEQTQWLSSGKLRELQAARLRAFLGRAEKHVPYFRDLFKRQGFQPTSVSSVDDLQQLPFMDKTTIRANKLSLRSEVAGRLMEMPTGGSSGEPLVFLVGKERISHDVAAKWRATRWWNVDIGDLEVVFWGSPIEMSRQDQLRMIRDRILRTHLLPAFQMSEQQLVGYVGVLQKMRPTIVSGYASALALVAEHAIGRDRALSDIGVRLCIATGETLFPMQREVIGRAFGAPVANLYGSRDAGFVAHDCPHGSLHIAAEHVIVEVVNENGKPVAPGEKGEIVTTHLATGDFPFVRYRTGDVAELATQECTCGRGLPVLREVYGRTTDFIRTKSGNIMHALALIYEVRDKPGVEAFKFIQRSDLSLNLLLVAGESLTRDVEDRIRRGLLARMGPELNLTIQRVDRIEPEKSGKYRYVVSEASTGLC